MYSERLLEHYRHPQNKGSLVQPDLAAEEYNPLCGDRVRIEARLDGERVAEVRFDGRGCALCLGAASVLTVLVEGRTLDELRVLGEEAFLAELESAVPPVRLNCALLPWVAWRRAAYGAASVP